MQALTEPYTGVLQLQVFCSYRCFAVTGSIPAYGKQATLRGY